VRDIIGRVSQNLMAAGGWPPIETIGDSILCIVSIDDQSRWHSNPGRRLNECYRLIQQCHRRGDGVAVRAAREVREDVPAYGSHVALIDTDEAGQFRIDQAAMGNDRRRGKKSRKMVT
jgi:hypothetical protein